MSWRSPYGALLGVGGIGSGMFFALEGNHTLGREESRGGQFLARRDYCKLHIISHYVRQLCGDDFVVLPIGRVGADPTGNQLRAEMEQAGLDLRYIRTTSTHETLFAVCLVYPDGSGGNLTSNHSACAEVGESDLEAALGDFARWHSAGIALAVPEVPLPTRVLFLNLATEYQLLRIASFISGEIPWVMEHQVLDRVDLLALNIDEAGAVLGKAGEDEVPEPIAKAAIEQLQRQHAKLSISITAGKHGSWIWDTSSISYRKALTVKVISTAGAGDAHLAGILSGMAAGLSLHQAHELGVLTAAMKVTCADTINFAIAPASLIDFANDQGIELSSELREVLTNRNPSTGGS